MADTYRPGDRDRDRNGPRPLTDRMTFTGGGDSYRPGDAQAQHGRAGNKPDFTFQSHHPAPNFPPTGPANPGPPPRKRNRGGVPQRDSRRGGPQDSARSRGRNNANGFRRGGFRKAAPHERALLQHREDTSPERALGVSDGPNRFLDLNDLSDDDEADMDVESGESDGEIAQVDGPDGNHKVARTQATSRADGDSIPKWSNPDPYTVLPPPEETTGKKTDFVKLIRKAKNQAAEKAAGHNAVAANDDFISFGDEDKVTESSELQILEDEIPTGPRHLRPLPKRPAEEIRNDELYIDDFVNGSGVSHYVDDLPQYPVQNHKRKRGDSGPAIVPEWEAHRNSDPTPWLPHPGAYEHLARDPDKDKW